MTSNITILETKTNDILNINNTFKNINECIEHLQAIKQNKNIIIKKVIFEEEEKETRTCTECNKEMIQGYCIENGEEYYCSDECLHNHYTQDEYLEMYNNGNGDSYWTEWECVE